MSNLIKYVAMLSLCVATACSASKTAKTLGEKTLPAKKSVSEQAVFYSIATSIEEVKKRADDDKYRLTASLDEVLSPDPKVREYVFNSYARLPMPPGSKSEPVTAQSTYEGFAKHCAYELLEIINIVESLDLSAQDLKITKPAQGKFNPNISYGLTVADYEFSYPLLIASAQHQRWTYVMYVFVEHCNPNMKFVAYMYLHQNNAVPAGLKKRLQEIAKDGEAFERRDEKAAKAKALPTETIIRTAKSQE